MSLSGRCACGTVTWTTEAKPLWAGNCHCDTCRRFTSAPFTSFLGVPRDSVTWTGALSEFKTSEGRITRQFCTKCGTQMTYQNVIWPSETHLYATTMDHPEKFKPQAHYHYAERLDWIEVTDDLPKYPASADMSDPL